MSGVSIDADVNGNHMTHASSVQSAPARTGIIYFIAALIILSVVGFLGYYFGFLGFIYKVMMPEALGAFPLVVLAMIFGTAAFFSPCTFTVLPAYVSHHLTGGAQEPRRSVAKGLYFGLVAAAGVIVVDVVVGLVIASLGAAAPFAKDPRQDIPIILGVRVVAGLLIAIMGVLAIKGTTFHVPVVERLLGKLSFKKSVFFYGVLYNGAALGCTGPILLGLMLYAFSTGSFTGAFLAFLVFALTMGLLMIVLTTAIGAFTAAFAKKLMPLTHVIKKFAGVVMIVVGLSIAVLTLEGNQIFVKIFFPFLK